MRRKSTCSTVYMKCAHARSGAKPRPGRRGGREGEKEPASPPQRPPPLLSLSLCGGVSRRMNEVKASAPGKCRTDGKLKAVLVFWRQILKSDMRPEMSLLCRVSALIHDHDCTFVHPFATFTFTNYNFTSQALVTLQCKID